MKRVLSLVLALVLVLGMIPTFAADMTGGQHLYEHEFIAGDGMGNLNEADMLTREQLAKLILELNGSKEEAEALTLPPSFTDSAKISAWARPYVAYAQIEGLMIGFSDGSFRPQEGVTGQQLAAVLTRALGYEFEWATVIADAADLGIEVPAVAKLTRGEAFEAMWVTVNTVPEGETLPLGTLLGKLADPTPVVVPLAVESVTAVNLKELVVKFNGAVDKTTAETAANYVITTTGTAATPVATLAADGMTVNIVLTTKATQQEVIKLQVKDVKDAAGVKMTAQTFENITFFDATVPTADAITLTGPTTFEVTFSEVMDSAVNPTVLVNNGIYGASFDSWDGNTAKFILSASLNEGTYTVKVSGAKDAAGYTALTKEFTLNYVKDTAAPVVSVDKADQLKVTFKFDKAVKNISTANFYHTFSAWTPLAVYKADGTTALLTTDFTTTVVVQFATSSTVGKPLVAGSNNVTVKVGASGSEIQDQWGNKLASDITFPVVVTADTTAPTVTKVEATDENIIKVTFDEAVTGADTAANYTIYDKDGKEVTTAFTPVYASKVATLTFVSDLAAGNYTVKVANITDTSIYGNKVVTNSYAFSISDLTAATGITAEWVVSGSNYLVYVTFSEEMQSASVLNKDNYRLEGAKLASTDTVELFGSSKIVKITTATDMSGNNVDVSVKNVVDAAGNTLDAFTTLTAANVTTAGAPAVTKTKTTALNTIEVTFNKHLSAAPAAAFEVNNVVPAAVTYVNNEDGTATATMILQAVGKLTNEGDVAVVVDIVANTVLSYTGKAAVIADGVQGAVTDGIAPVFAASNAVTTYDTDSNGQIDTIVVAYSEAINKATVSLLTYDVAGYTETAEYVVTAANAAAASVIAQGASANGNFVVIKLTEKATPDTSATPAVTQSLAIKDVAGNTLAAQAAKTAVDKAAPVLLSAEATVGSADLVLTFSEKVVGGDGTTAATLALADFNYTDVSTDGAASVTVPATSTAGVTTVTLTLDVVAIAADISTPDTINCVATSVYDLAGNAAANTAVGLQ